MDKPEDLSRREFFSRSLGMGLWVLLLYPFIRLWSATGRQRPQNVSRHPASWYKRLAG